MKMCWNRLSWLSIFYCCVVYVKDAPLSVHCTHAHIHTHTHTHARAQSTTTATTIQVTLCHFLPLPPGAHMCGIGAVMWLPLSPTCIHVQRLRSNSSVQPFSSVPPDQMDQIPLIIAEKLRDIADRKIQARARADQQGILDRVMQNVPPVNDTLFSNELLQEEFRRQLADILPPHTTETIESTLSAWVEALVMAQTLLQGVAYEDQHSMDDLIQRLEDVVFDLFRTKHALTLVNMCKSNFQRVVSVFCPLPGCSALYSSPVYHRTTFYHLIILCVSDSFWKHTRARAHTHAHKHTHTHTRMRAHTCTHYYSCPEESSKLDLTLTNVERGMPNMSLTQCWNVVHVFADKCQIVTIM